MALVEERSLRPFDFEAEVSNGRVVLRGEVETEEERRTAAEVVRRVDGVRDVINEVTALNMPELAEADDLEVDPGADTIRTEDAPLAQRDPRQPTEMDEVQPQTTPEQPEPSAPQNQPATPSTDQQQDEEPQSQHHVVRSGESLWTISRQYGTSIDQIRRLNNLRSDRLRPGQRLRVR